MATEEAKAEQVDAQVRRASEEELKELAKQLSFYFSDPNLRRDKFMKKEMNEETGYFPVDLFLKFKKVASLTSSLEDVQQALEQCDELELDETKANVRRKVPFDANKDHAKGAVKRSLFVDGFPEDTSVEDIKQCFSDIVGTDRVAFVQKRFAYGKDLGNVLIEFASEEDASKVFEKKDELKYGSVNLSEVLWLSEWLKRINEENEEKRKQKKRSREEGDGNEKSDKKPLVFDKGCIVKAEGLGEACEWGMLKKALGDQVAFVQVKGQVGTIRFKTPEAAKEGVEKLKTIAVEEIGGTTPTNVVVLEGEEEESFWKRVQADMDKKTNARNQRPNRKGRGNNKKQRSK